MNRHRISKICGTALTAALFTTQAQASEGFRLRYNLVGSLGGEIFVVNEPQGLAAGAALTSIRIDKITGDDGNAGVKIKVPGGTVNVGNGMPAALNPSYGSNEVVLNGTGDQTMVDLGMGYITSKDYGGGRLSFAASFPFATKHTDTRLSGNTPGLQWPHPTLPDASSREQVQAGFNNRYQGSLNAAGAAATGDAESLGDLSLFGGWIYATGNVRIVTGASLVAPTGNYDQNKPTNISTGDFYTLRPGIQIGWRPTDRIAVGAKATLGINSKNRKTDVKSGDWLGLEGALGYMTPVGPIGLQAVYVHQYQNDSGDGNVYGANRLRSMNLGVFATTKIPGIDTYCTLHYMRTVSSRNAQSGQFVQLRFVRPF